jgi:ATP-dependent Clp protease, protease subunit
MDRLLADLFGCPPETIEQWVRANRYVTGAELAAAGLAEMVQLKPLAFLRKR